MRDRTGLTRGVALMLVLFLAAGFAHAQPVASLDRERITLGESVTLRIEASRLVTGAPDLSALEDRVAVLQRSGRTEFTQGRSRSVWEFSLMPREEGVIGIPALDWAGGRTQPLSLTVLPAAPGTAGEGAPIFIEVEIDDPEPYVQQALTYTLRLGYRVTLLEGRLDAPEVGDGGSLRQSGEDVSYQREIGGHRYRIVERRYVLVADRSGELRIDPPRFQGRVQPQGSPFGAFQSVTEVGEALLLRVRPRPPGADAHWLPARSLRLSLAPPPDRVRQGEPVTLALRVRAEGVARDQLAGLELPEGRGYQIYPEIPELSERVEDGRVVVEGVRRFVVVALDDERLVIAPSTLAWWDLDQDRPAQVEIPGLDIVVEPDAALSAGATVAGAPDPLTGDPGAYTAGSAWKWLSVLLATGWLATLIVVMRPRMRPGPVPGADRQTGDGGAGTARRGAAAIKLRRALEEGDLAGVEHALVAAAPAACTGLAQVVGLLAEPDQCEAVDALMHARWGGGDPVRAREALRRAFRGGPRWRASTPAAAAGPQPLAPLYPGRRS